MNYFMPANVLVFSGVNEGKETCFLEGKRKQYLPLYPKMATVMVSKAHKLKPGSGCSAQTLDPLPP